MQTSFVFVFWFIAACCAEASPALDRSDATNFFFPFAKLRDRQVGYPVSVIKAGVELIGRHPGPVRPPLTNLTGEEKEMLRGLIAQAG